jgi:hypothetical protein
VFFGTAAMPNEGDSSSAAAAAASSNNSSSGGSGSSIVADQQQADASTTSVDTVNTANALEVNVLTCTYIMLCLE